MTTKADLHRPGRVDQPLVGRVGAPVRGAFFRAKEMVNRCEDIGMRIEMQKADFLALGQSAAAKPRIIPPVIEWSPPIDTGRAPLASMPR